ncbi:MAG: AAA family ATPase, partial [Janthinobacterium lividum]
RRDCTERIVRLLGELTSSSRQPLLHTINGSVRNVVRCDWEQLVLSPDVVSLLKNDFESFFRRESWYLEKGVPFRRGYLLHGAPGNGKSSAIRAMLSGQGLTAYTLRFFDPHVDDADLEHLFDRALRERPSMILLEDIDRAFPRTSESKTGISLQALLNALDGVGSGQGIVVVATANEPTLLDPAILKRPGRFDRVVHFGNPDESLRHKFFSRFMPELSAVELTETVSITSGFSFAQLREVFVLAGQFAFERDAKMESGDLCRAAISLRDSSSAASRSQFAAGFISC